MVTETKTNDTYHVSTIFDGDLTSTTVYHLPTGTRATGHARRYEVDMYNKYVGYYLSYYRAFERLSNKISKNIIKALPELGV